MTAQTVRVSFNVQQFELIARTVAEGVASDPAAVVLTALREFNAPLRPRAAPPKAPVRRPDGPSARTLRYEHTMQPGTGKAIAVTAGQILRIEQTTGQQCVDFNCFNLHDYREVMHVGRMRAMYGLNPTQGHFIWSAPPRERAMMFILEDTARFNDVMFSRCNAYLYESAYGFATHTNCHDIQAEAQREYGLTPDDVHDSFNMFMCTEVVGTSLQINRPPPGGPHRIELLAMFDVLAVLNVCGNDVGRTSNFQLKAIRLKVFDASADDLAKVPTLKTYPHSQRDPSSFRQPRIKADRPLAREASYVPQFTNVPLRETIVTVTLDPSDLALLDTFGLAPHYGSDLGGMLRDVALSWWEKNFTSFLPGTAE